MRRQCRNAALAACAALALIGGAAAQAKAATQMEQAELSGLAPSCGPRLKHGLSAATRSPRSCR